MAGESGSVEARLQAIRRLPKDREALDTLLIALGDPEWRVRKEASLVLLDRADKDTILRLAALLEDEANAGARNAAIDALIRMGSLAVVPLLGLWDKASGDVRKFLVDILGAIPDPRTASFLLKLLKREHDPNILATAIEAVGLRGLSEAVPELLEILGRGDAWLSYPAAEALGKLRDPRALPPLLGLLSDPFLQEPAIYALGALGDVRVILPILQRLAASSGERGLTHKGRDAALEALGSLAGEADGDRLVQEGLRQVPDILPTLGQTLGSAAADAGGEMTRASKGVLRGSIVLLGLAQDRSAAPLLLDLIEEDSLREDVALALGRMGEEIVPLLLERLTRTQGEPRGALCKALGLAGSPLALGGLGAVLNDLDPGVREAAARALGALGDFTAVDILLPLLEDSEVGVQDAAVEALEYLVIHADVGRGGAPKKGVGFWAGFLKEPSPARRRNAVRLLGRLARVTERRHEAVEALYSALQDSEAQVRMAVMEALGALGDCSVSDALISGLTDEVPQVRVRAIQGLGQCFAEEPPGRPLDTARRSEIRPGGTHGRPVGGLIAMLGDPDPWVQAEAARALGQVGDPEALTALRSVFEPFDPAGRTKGRPEPQPLLLITGLETLASHIEPEDAGPVRSLIQHPDPEVRRSALLALEGLGEAAWLAAQEALTDSHWAVRLAAVEVLGRLGPEAPLRAGAGAGDAPWRDSAQSLRRSSGQALRAPLEALATGDPDAMVRQVASRILGTLPEG